MTTVIMEGRVGDEITAQGVREELERANGEDVLILLNSPGGSVWSGYSIHDAIRAYSGRVTVKIVGLAGSIASYIMLAADTIIAQDQASVMVHDPSSITAGTADDHQKSVTVLEGLASQLAQAYAGRMGIDAAEARDLMRAETWYFGQQIVDAGLADSMEESPVNAYTDRLQLVAMARSSFSATPDASYEQAAAEILDITASRLSPEDRQAALFAGMTASEYRRYTGGDPSGPLPAGMSEEDAAAARMMRMDYSEYQKYSKEAVR
ncbi:MAG: head maturation protease, ClpP-related [Alkalispirochaeta sp.]